MSFYTDNPVTPIIRRDTQTTASSANDISVLKSSNLSGPVYHKMANSGPGLRYMSELVSSHQFAGSALVAPIALGPGPVKGEILISFEDVATGNRWSVKLLGEQNGAGVYSYAALTSLLGTAGNCGVVTVNPLSFTITDSAARVYSIVFAAGVPSIIQTVGVNPAGSVNVVIQHSSMNN